MTDTCLHGHPWTPETTIVRRNSRGGRQRECRTCRTARRRDQRAARWETRHAGHDTTRDAAGRRRCTTCPPPSRAATDSRADDVLALHHRGLTVEEIAGRVDCSDRTVLRILSRTLAEPERSTDMAAPVTLARPDRWRDQAACAGQDPEAFFPDPSDAFGIQHAKTICGSCPARSACLEDALRAEGGSRPSARWGIRGGLTPEQRHNVYRARTRGSRAAADGRSP